MREWVFLFCLKKKSKMASHSLIKYFKTLLWKSSTFLFSKWRTILLQFLLPDERLKNDSPPLALKLMLLPALGRPSFVLSGATFGAHDCWQRNHPVTLTSGASFSKTSKTNGQPNIRDTWSVPRVLELSSSQVFTWNASFKIVLIFENFKRVKQESHW